MHSIGHTQQRPNCDRVAAACAPVPTETAELVVPSRRDARRARPPTWTKLYVIQRRKPPRASYRCAAPGRDLGACG